MHPETGEVRREIIIVPCGSMCSGSPLSAVAAGVYSLGSLNFSISLSFAGAMW